MNPTSLRINRLITSRRTSKVTEMKNSRFRRPIEFAVMVAIYCGSSVLCYEAGARKVEPTVPVPPTASPVTDPAPKQAQPAEAPQPRRVAEAQPVSQTKIAAEAPPVAKPVAKPPVAKPVPKPVAKPVAPVVQPNQCQLEECQQFYRRRRRR